MLRLDHTDTVLEFEAHKRASDESLEQIVSEESEIACSETVEHCRLELESTDQ